MKTKTRMYAASAFFLATALAVTSVSADPWSRHVHNDAWANAAKDTCKRHGVTCNEKTQRYQVTSGGNGCRCVNK